MQVAGGTGNMATLGWPGGLQAPENDHSDRSSGEGLVGQTPGHLHARTPRGWWRSGVGSWGNPPKTPKKASVVKDSMFGASLCAVLSCQSHCA